MSNHLPLIHKTIFAFLIFVVLFISQKSFATVFTIDIALTGGRGSTVKSLNRLGKFNRNLRRCNKYFKF